MTRYAWLFVIPVLAIIVVVAIAIIRFRKRLLHRNKKEKVALVAHTKFVRNLPEYTAAKKRYNVMLCLLAVFFVVSIGSTSITASRPITITESKSEKENRDIMLCLDVSGSMSGSKDQLLKYFKELVSQMEGERFGITVFDGIYATLSPLSTDYDSLIETLDDLINNLSDYSGAISQLSNFSSSEIGPGLVGCISAFDKLGEAERSRSIVLATDNLASNTQVVNLLQAANYAKSFGITVYGLNTADKRTQDEIDETGENDWSTYRKEFREAVLITGGSYYAFGSNSDMTAKQIVDQILAQEAARFEGAGQIIKTDAPKVPAIVATIVLLIYIILAWRLRL